MGQPKYRLLNNSRFYVLVSSLLLSLVVFAWLRLQISSDQLFYIRSQQVFGFLCVAYWYFALTISPIGYIIGKERTRHIEFARRAVGVSAFYFALLHASIALWSQLGGLGQLQYLPSLFKWSLAGGLVGFCILLIMAATSLDKVIEFMTFRRWKWLHRLGYIGGVLVVLHIWTIGTHLAYSNTQIVAFCALVVLGGLETFRVTKLLNKKLNLDKVEAAGLHLALWALVVIAVLAMPYFVRNYHGRHESGDGSSHSQGHR